MKNLLALICGLIFFASCSNSNAPENLIDKKEMVNVLIDMHLADASLDNIRQDSILIYAKSKYNALFKRHNIDSSAFTNSLKYYSNGNDFINMYNDVLDSLKRINKPEVIKIQRTKRFIPDSLRFELAKANKIRKDSVAKADSLNTRKKLVFTKMKPVVVKDTIIKEVKKSALDGYLRKTDSLNTVKLLGIGIDF